MPTFEELLNNADKDVLKQIGGYSTIGSPVTDTEAAE